MRKMVQVDLIGFLFVMVAVGTVRGCTTPGLLPMRDQRLWPFCCHPSYGDTHCPIGARCERDTYYGYGFICCGSINMVWDAYGGNYKKWEYEGCGIRPNQPNTGTGVMPWFPRPPREWTEWNSMAKNNTGFEPMPGNWTDSDGPLVAPIIVGEYRESSDSKDGGWRGKASVTLVRDGSCTILVDTGASTDEKLIIKGLSSYGLKVEDVHYVVITQGTPDHMGNQNLFPKSKIFYAWITLDRDHFVMTDLGKNNFIRLCSSTELHLTPGVTKDAISLLVHNVTNYGTVAIVGDLFLYDHSPDFIPKQFAGFIWDVQALLQSREKLLCQTDWIVPGHGAKFSVPNLKKTFADSKRNCSDLLLINELKEEALGKKKFMEDSVKRIMK